MYLLILIIYHILLWFYHLQCNFTPSTMVKSLIMHGLKWDFTAETFQDINLHQQKFKNWANCPYSEIKVKLRWKERGSLLKHQRASELWSVVCCLHVFVCASVSSHLLLCRRINGWVIFIAQTSQRWQNKTEAQCARSQSLIYFS